MSGAVARSEALLNGRLAARFVMRMLVLLSLCAGAVLVGARNASAEAEDRPPQWAYPVNPSDFKLPPDDGKPRQVPDSPVAYSVSQTRDRFLAPDWHPADHLPMPEIVAQGRKPEVFACGYCHRADGPGGPENANLAGLPAAYIIRQMADFKNGLRKTSVPERGPPQLMIGLAKAASGDEVRISAEYFAAIKPRSTIKVIESDTVPKTTVAGWFLADAKTGEREPIGNRIIEIPEDLAQFENRDTRSHFVAYVPAGSIKKGEALAAKGIDGTATRCEACHGPGLAGLAEVPGIAGRSPSYIARQLFDFKHGARAGDQSALMKPVVEHLSLDDMLALAAYAASLPVQGNSRN
jgi:cytochrome c553